MIHLIPGRSITPFGAPRATMISETARVVPDAPKAASQPYLRKRAATGSSSSCAAVRARFMRFSLIVPSEKCSTVRLTQPMYRLSRRFVARPSPMMSSVLPPPISTTSRRPASLGVVCATPR